MLVMSEENPKIISGTVEPAASLGWVKDGFVKKEDILQLAASDGLNQTTAVTEVRVAPFGGIPQASTPGLLGWWPGNGNAIRPSAVAPAAMRSRNSCVLPRSASSDKACIAGSSALIAGTRR